MWTEEFKKEYSKQYRLDNREDIAVKQRLWKAKNKERNNLLNKGERVRLKSLILSFYGVDGRAECCKCGYKDIRALALDHINNNGAEERIGKLGKRTAAGTTFYRYIKRLGFPPGYQTLCFNCNIIKQIETL